MFVSHPYVFFGDMSIYFFGSFFDWAIYFLELSCRSCLYIFEINSLSVASFAIIFSHSEGCLFTLLIVSFVVYISIFVMTLLLYVYFNLLGQRK